MRHAPAQETHLKYLRQALSLAQLSEPKPTNFRVGCVIVSYALGTDDTAGTPLSTGYTLELAGNTHAEQCALAKLAQQHNIPEEQLNEVLTPEVNAVLYTTLEPCGKRLSGNLPCVERIIGTRQGNSSGGVRKVIFGAKEPGTFVQESQSLQRLDQAGVEWEFVQGLDDEILKVAMEGHVQKDNVGLEHNQASSRPGHQGQSVGRESQSLQQGTNVADISPEERKRQEALPRNPKKRMMEVDVPP
ncbi:uncharacterized protein A1O9_09966 [Exophiala aquamarina CBS 119918]|uniref:CMP/dCMP-type deaminase domain-containing protein n=1 Tax=Exophiala aquamarina CBS 119918 TaxID=1182545 RepID=A0A072P2V3_9EURO|nr:uncharacterized protein A1O9_09966 [Exophiala aquamarina CBS 119918]KEF54171.1 hypothetical protein A1O9_09966 [Exophiala aquamarina CBS 119918]